MYNFSKDEIIDNRFTVIDKKGGGGFGEVLEVLDIENGERIALKYCNSNLEEDILRFKREVKKMSEIVHPNVISVLESNVDYTPPYFTMPLAEKTVSQIIETELCGRLDATIHVFDQICAGITIIHASGHTHRDIKPENVLILENAQIVVSDLGLIKKNERDSVALTRTNIAIGSTAYAPPEIYEPGGTRDMDHRGDIYMLGKTLYHLYTNLTPTVLNPKALPIGLWLVIKRATQHYPDDRYQSVGEMLDSLHDVQIALSPEVNYNSTFQSLLISAEEELKQNEYDEVNVRQILLLLSRIEDEEDFLDLFHKIPTKLLSIIPNNFTDECEIVMGKYCNSIKSNVGGMAFPFADQVSLRMIIIYKSSSSSNIKKLALISILYAAVNLNRFAVKDTFDSLLEAIKEDELAFEVADGLDDELSCYSQLYQRIPRNKLHPAIQNVWDRCLASERVEELEF